VISGNVTWSGLDELQAALRTLPKELADEATGIVWETADTVAREIAAAYPVRATGLTPGPTRKSPWYAPGLLRKGVKVTRSRPGDAVTSATVINTNPLALIFEFGTQARHNTLGANRGSMPPGHVFMPRYYRARARMYLQLKQLLVTHGLIVTGEAA
jgi:hypothetical protein